MEIIRPIPTRAQIARAWLKQAHSFDRCGPLARWDFESANHGLPVTLRRIKGKPQTAETAMFAMLWVISTSGCYAFVSTANRKWPWNPIGQGSRFFQRMTQGTPGDEVGLNSNWNFSSLHNMKCPSWTRMKREEGRPTDRTENGKCTNVTKRRSRVG